MDDAQKKIKLKKLIKMLDAIKGRHTELVTVYVPVGYNLHEVAAQLRSEQSTAENIKSKPVRKNVTTALEKIMRHMQLYKKTPENGLALFCGNVSEREGAADMELWAIEPPEPIKTKLYWCDQRFVLEPLLEMIKEKDIHGLICLDKNEADIGILRGKKVEPVVHFESIVPGKSRAGGQSAMRFSRVREGLLNDWLKKIGEAANKIFEEHQEAKDIILGGPGPIKEIFLKEDYMHADIKKKIVGTVNTSYTGEFGLHEIVEKGEELLKESEVIKEKKLLQRFFNELQKPHSLVAYGIAEVIKAIEAGAADTVVISDASDLKEIEYECQCGITKKFASEKNKSGQKCGECKQIKQILGEKDLIDAIDEIAKSYGTKMEIVSADTREGKQFLELGGIGAFLRYEMQ